MNVLAIISFNYEKFWSTGIFQTENRGFHIDYHIPVLYFYSRTIMRKGLVFSRLREFPLWSYIF